MPRRNRPRNAPKRDADAEPLRAPDVTIGAPHGWTVRMIQPSNATKTYLCPGCNHDVRPGVKHVVAWRDGAEDMRRHWHTPCWERQARGLR